MRLAAGSRGPLALAVLILVLSLPALGLAQPTFPPLTGRVVDNANLLSPQSEQQLADKLAALEQTTGNQLVVATLPDLQGYEIEEYGYRLGRAWGIGREAEDDGVLLIVAPNERKVRIEVGYGLEPVLTDALSSVILQEQVLPRFRDGEMEQGVLAGAQAIIDQLALPEDQARALAAQAAEQQAEDDGSGVVPLAVLILAALWIVSGIFRAMDYRRSGNSLWWLLPWIIASGGGGGGGGGRHHGGGWSGGFGGGGGFSGGGGSFGGGGSSGGW